MLASSCPIATPYGRRGAADRSVLNNRLTVLRWLLVAYFVGSLVIALPLLFHVTHAGEFSGTTSGKILAAALIAMGIGALGAARDPRGQRLMIQILIVFTTLAALAIVYRLVAERHSHDPAWLLLPAAAAAPILFALFYPRRG